MHDAVALANWINTIEAPSMYHLKKIFKEYRAERYPIVKQAFETSQMFSRNIGKVTTWACLYMVQNFTSPC